MAGDTNYVLIWFIYLASGAVFFLVFWKFTALFGRLSAWISRTFMAALILTPIFPSGEGETAVPALMAVALDTIASGPEAAARGLAALAAGMVVAILGAMVLFLGLTFVRRGNSEVSRRDSAALRGMTGHEQEIQGSSNHDADS